MFAQALSPDYSHKRVTASKFVRPGHPPQKISQLISDAPNVARIARIFPSSQWDSIFPHANKDEGPASSPYNYSNFLGAAWKFPYFCGEPDQSDEECMHELVVMFSHIVQETGGKRDHPGPGGAELDGLYWYREIGCYDPGNPHHEICGKQYCSEAGIWGVFPCGNRAYYGRGAKQLSWNYNYAFFSKAMTGTAETYLIEPDRIITDGWPALASAIWFWMTPQLPKPSMHEIVTGLWTPNAADLAAGIVVGFGTTTNIINGAMECGQGTESSYSSYRMQYYRALCDTLKAQCFSEVAADGCGKMNSQFPEAGTAGNGPLIYLDKSWSGSQECAPVKYQMPFLVGQDETSCLCHFWPQNTVCSATVQVQTTSNAVSHSSKVNTGSEDSKITNTIKSTTTTPGKKNSILGDCVGATVPEWGECNGSTCCAAGLKCYEYNQWWAACRSECDPQSSWSCQVLSDISQESAVEETSVSSREFTHLRGTKEEGESTTVTSKQHDSGCDQVGAEWSGCTEHHCCGEGLQCYEQNQWWAQCLKSCDPQQKSKASGTPWTCKILTH
jgi:hypothetical protein